MNFCESGLVLFVTVRAKTSLVHTSKFASLEIYNFPYERGLVEQTSLYDLKIAALCDTPTGF